MADGDKSEARCVTMYPQEWDAVDLAAESRGLVTARGPNTSQMLRQIIREWQEARESKDASQPS